MRPVTLGALALVSLGAHARHAAAQAVTPGAIRTYSTPQSIGVEWDVTGDPDHDASVAVRYRESGAASWSDAHPLFRVDFNAQNMLAGSVLFLAGGQAYDVELALTDPDGGSETQTVTVSTTPVPALPTSGRTLHVIPGAGGGSGTEADPFQGIEAADAAALPGDVLLVHAGFYGGAQVLFDAAGTPGNYVAWVAADADPPELDDLRIRGDYIWIEGFDISAPDNAVRNEGASVGAVVKGNRITGCHYCIHLNTGAEGWWISDNVIVGDQDPASGSLSGEGIELEHTGGHTVAYNSISRAADGVSYPDRNVDIFGNDIFETSDDGIEADSGYANIRIWGNRIHHAHNNGITFQPMNSAPWYVLRNQVIGSNESVLKVRTAVDRVLLAHNTFVGWSRVFQNDVGFIRNMQVRNNLWITVQGDYFWEDTGSDGTPESWRTDIDWDGFSWPDSTTLPLFKWLNVRYDDLTALQAATTIEANAIRAPLSCYETLNVPGPAPALIPPHRVTLTSGCNAIDAGEVMPNINDGFVGAGPDLGAHEAGAAELPYGPRVVTAATGVDAGVPAGGAGGVPGTAGTPGSGGGGAVATGGVSALGGASTADGSAGSRSAGGAEASADASVAGGSSSSSTSSDGGGCGCRAARTAPAGAAGMMLAGVALAIVRQRVRGARGARHRSSNEVDHSGLPG